MHSLALRFLDFRFLIMRRKRGKNRWKLFAYLHRPQDTAGVRANKGTGLSCPLYLPPVTALPSTLCEFLPSNPRLTSEAGRSPPRLVHQAMATQLSLDASLTKLVLSA
jgi:hypothetical protein